ncbi:hypothetical protein HY641_00865 [Candidatus Woesearchaeota archaeon]|nr:hypothetical protein [Candidatus Woesearchaeota archaeon]
MPNPTNRTKQRDAHEKALRKSIASDLKLLKKEHARIKAATNAMEEDIKKTAKNVEGASIRSAQLTSMLRDLRTIRSKARKLLKNGFG